MPPTPEHPTATKPHAPTPPASTVTPALTEEQLVDLFFHETLLPELQQALGGSEGLRNLAAVFGGISLTVPTLGELQRCRHDLEITFAVRRFEAGEISKDELESYAAARGVTQWMRIFPVARRVERLLAAVPLPTDSAAPQPPQTAGPHKQAAVKAHT